MVPLTVIKGPDLSYQSLGPSNHRRLIVLVEPFATNGRSGLKKSFGLCTFHPKTLLLASCRLHKSSSPFTIPSDWTTIYDKDGQGHVMDKITESLNPFLKVHSWC